MNRPYRSGASGPLAGINMDASAIGLDGSVSATITSLSAPHTPGLYLLSVNAFRRVAGAGGTVTIQHTWSYPEFGATSLNRGAFALTSTGSVGFLAPLLVRSDGEADILTLVTFTTPSGTPLVDVSTTLEFLGAID